MPVLLEIHVCWALRLVDWYIVTHVSKDCNVFISSAKLLTNMGTGKYSVFHKGLNDLNLVYFTY